MSLHASLTACHRVPRDDDGVETGWKAACECGWEGPLRSTYADSEAPAHADRDYRLHVEESLGAAAYYDAGVACRNCGSEHRQGVLIGTHVSSARCSRCGTRMLDPRNDAWDASRAESRRLFGG